MAWATAAYSVAFGKGSNDLSVGWRRTDSTIPGAAKQGSFTHTAADGDTLATIRSAIETKIAADEGVAT